MDLIIYRTGTEVARVSIDEQTVLTKKLMNEDKISSEFYSENVIPIEIGDYIEYNSKKYYLNSLPNIEKLNNKSFKYTVFFQSDLYSLYNKLFISIDGLNDFVLIDNAENVLNQIVSNMNEISSGWSVGAVDETSEKSISFVNENLRTALTKISLEFGMEFEVVNKVINFKKAIGNVTNFTFEYGQNNGLYSIERRGVDNTSVITKAYGYGAAKNLPYTYRDRAKRLVFEERFLTQNEDVYGVREGHYTNEDIYPHRTGTLTDVNMEFNVDGYDSNLSFVEDTSIDFNLNDYLLEGTIAKIVFKSGDLSGSQFDIWKYEDSKIYFNAIGEADGYSAPNEDAKAKIGDTYTLIDIDMPPSYVIAAELELKNATQVFLDENSTPKSLYLVKIDPKYSKANSILLDAGDLVKIIDTQMGINRAIRISQVSFPIVNPYKISATIADFIPYSLQQLVSKTAAKTSKEIKSIVNKITNVQNVTNKTYNTTVIKSKPEPETGVIYINGRKYKHIKGFDNSDQTILEAGDSISGNYFDRFTYVDEWMYLGGIKEKIESWEQIITTETTV